MADGPSGDPMLELLSANGPDPEHAQALMLYGRLVGTWEIRNRYLFPDGRWRTAAGEWRFGWALGGRVVQDVLWCPDFHGRFPGTTLRMYDVTTGLWRITWISPKLPSYFSQVGRGDGAGGMVQEGTDAQGRRSRWTFTEVTPTSFRWQGFSASPLSPGSPDAPLSLDAPLSPGSPDAPLFPGSPGSPGAAGAVGAVDSPGSPEGGFELFQEMYATRTG